MRDDEFEWNDKKTARNFRDHGVTFETARLAFNDPTASMRMTQTRTRSATIDSAGSANECWW